MLTPPPLNGIILMLNMTQNLFVNDPNVGNYLHQIFHIILQIIN